MWYATLVCLAGYNLLYQCGVLISRASGSLFTLPRSILNMLVVVQVALLVSFISDVRVSTLPTPSPHHLRACKWAVSTRCWLDSATHVHTLHGLRVRAHRPHLRP